MANVNELHVSIAMASQRGLGVQPARRPGARASLSVFWRRRRLELWSADSTIVGVEAT